MKTKYSQSGRKFRRQIKDFLAKKTRDKKPWSQS